METFSVRHYDYSEHDKVYLEKFPTHPKILKKVDLFRAFVADTYVCVFPNHCGLTLSRLSEAYMEDRNYALGRLYLLS